MKRHMAAIFAATVLATALAGCVPMDETSAESTPATVPPSIQAAPTTPVPDLEPYSTEGLAERVSGFSEQSPAREILAGTFSLDGAVPGSAHLLYAEISTSGQQAVIPRAGDGDMLGVLVWCSEDTSFKVDIIDAAPARHLGSVSGHCDPDGSGGGMFGAGEGAGPIYLDFKPGSAVSAEVVVFRYQQAELTD